MPYGSKSESSKWSNNFRRVDSGVVTTSVQQANVTQTYWSRSGTNYNPRRIQSPKSQKRYKWVKTEELVPFVKKVREFDPRRNKWVTRRIPIYRWKWVKVAIPKSKTTYTIDMKTNNLTFYGEKFKNRTPSGSITSIGTGLSWGTRQPRWDYTGSPSVFGTGLPSGWGTGSMDPISPNALTSSSLPAEFSVIVNRLKAKGYDSLREKAKSQEINLLNAIGERRQTMSMLADTISRLASAISSARRGNLLKAARKLFPTNSKELANDVLLINFGVKPFLSDIEGAAKHLARRQSQSPTSVIKAANKEVVRDVQMYTASNSILSRKLYVSKETEITVRHVMEIKIDDGTTFEANQLGLLNIPSTLWELTPWSFAIDWLIPIGDFLNKVDAFAGLSITRYHITTVIKQKVTVTCVHDGTVGAIGYQCYTSGTTGVWEKELLYVNRAVQANNPPPMQFPSIRNPFTTTRLVNATALLRQLKG